MERLQTPILLIIYKRIETTRQVLDKIRMVKPAKLYISANGPNPLNPADRAKCEETRNISKEIDWDCEVVTSFRDHHLSAKDSITGGITWFFSKEEEGIILEDDCVVDASFFSFSQELLTKYRNVPKVMHIGASNFQNNTIRGVGSYYFSKYNHIWGWAGWRRSWQGYDVNFCARPLDDFLPVLKRTFKRADIQNFWIDIYRYLKSGKVDTWDTQYMFHLWNKGGIAITPNVNLVKNIGFGKEATNTNSPLSKWANLSVGSMTEIKHPENLSVNQAADLFTSDYFYRIGSASKFFNLKLKVSRYIPVGLKRKLKAIFRFS